MDRNRRGLACFILSGPLCAIAAMFVLLGRHSAQASPGVHYVAPLGNCGGMSPCYGTIQAAVDAAEPGDRVLVARGSYAGVNTHGGLAQVVYVTKSIGIHGGYSTTDWSTPDPENNVTTLDAQGQGRVIYVEGPITVTVQGLRLTGGDATGLGGGFWPWMDAGGGLYANGSTLELAHCRLYANTTRWDGGGLYLVDSNSDLRENDIIENTAERYAGGLLLYRGSATLSHNTIVENMADTYGGAAMLASDATLTNNLIALNASTGGFGGGLRVEGGNVQLTGNRITGNTSQTAAGGLSLSGANALIEGNEVTNNVAQGYGAGIAGWRSSLLLTGNIIYANATTGGGYGAGLRLSESDATFVNNIIAENHASGTAGAVYARACSLQLLHNTIARNTSSDGIGIYATGRWEDSDDPPYDRVYQASSVAMTNTIVVSHTVGLYVTENNTATLEATLWGTGAWANETDWAGGGAIVTGTVNVWGDPGFIDALQGDFHIGPGSAAIDAGIDAGVTADIDNESRPNGGGFDIGADEAPYPLMIRKDDYPDPVSPGSALTYTITVGNTSEEPLGNVLITDSVPSNTVFTWGSHGGGELSGVVSWTIPYLEVGEWVSRTMLVTVAEGLADGALIENAEYGVTSEQSPSPVMGSPISTLVGFPLLAIVKEVEPSIVSPGGELAYTLIVSNEGELQAAGLVITDRVPTNTTFSWASDGGGQSGDQVVWTDLSAGPGDSVQVSWGVTATESLLVSEIVNDAYGARVTGAEPVMGAPLRTPLLRYRWPYPLIMKEYEQ